MADRKRESNQIGHLASNGRDLYVTASRRGFNGSGDPIDMLLGATRQDDQGGATDAEVLLMTDGICGSSTRAAGRAYGLERRSGAISSIMVPIASVDTQAGISRHVKTGD
jgi:hypothetical protein